RGYAMQRHPLPHRLKVGALCLALGNLGLAQAQENDSATLDAVVVTAQKRTETAQEVPLTVDVIDGQALSDSGAGRTAGEITRFIPNASAATLDNHGFPRWFIRGVGTGEPSLNNVTPIGIYTDDVYLGSAFLTGAPLFDIERVEVLPGPQGTLWGKNSPGGAVHIVTRKPVFKQEGWLKADLGDYKARTVQGAINHVLKEDTLALRVSFSSDGREQYARNITKDATGKLDDNALRAQLAAVLTPELDVLLSAHHRRYTQNDITSYIVFGEQGKTDSYGNPYAVWPDRVYAFNEPSDTLREQSGISLTLNWTPGKYTLTSITAFERATETGTSGDGVPQEIYRSYADNTIKQVSQEFRLASPREDRWNWITGIHLYKQDIDSFSATGSLDPARQSVSNPGFTRADWTHHNKSFAVFGSTTYAFTDRFKLTGGLRWTRESKKLDSTRDRQVTGVNFTGNRHWWDANDAALTRYVATDGDKTWTAISGDITPEYRINDNLRTYLRFARGFRSGGFVASPATQAAAGSFAPEYLNAVEWGVKSEWLNGRAILNASLFHYDYKDIQINVIRGDATLGAVSRMQNAGSARVYGAEFQGVWAPTDNLRLRGSIGLLRTRYTDYTSGGNDYSGNEFGRAPHITAVLGFDYRLPLGGDHALTFGGDINTRSKFSFSATDPENPANQQSGYTLINLRAGYRLDPKTHLNFYVDNATDKAYSQASLPRGLTAVGSSLGAPRTWGVTLNYQW
ncbi:MAG: TonB-dependent receptor, partial [Zoogloeaceae bacterium]|nr:TonB-dependent receptor [Zoogloeaceae bacterium]